MTALPYRTLIVDDEPAARRGLRLLLERDPELAIVGEAGSGREAVRLLQAQRPDLLLLDIEMPELDGFKVLETITGGPAPAVIFVTAHDEHALRAFSVNAVDYLLKPVEDERFWTAVTRAKAHLAQRASGDLSARLQQLLAWIQAHPRGLPPTPAEPGGATEAITRERILLKSGGEVLFLKTGEIDWIEAEGDYMKFHAGGRSHLLRETMQRLEARLDPARFVRIHRSTIVNLDRVRKLSPDFAGEYAVVLQDGSKLRLSRGYHDRLFQALKGATP